MSSEIYDNYNNYSNHFRNVECFNYVLTMLFVIYV